MEEINTTNIATDTSGATNTSTNNVLTITQADLNKQIQSETDKVRTEYSKKVKELENKVKELTPVEKSEAEIDFEKRLAALEAREKSIKLHDDLSEKGISNELANYLKADVDVDELSAVYEKILKSEVDKRLKNSGYTPNNHKSGETMSKEDFQKLNMTEKEALFTENPELYKVLSKK